LHVLSLYYYRKFLEKIFWLIDIIFILTKFVLFPGNIERLRRGDDGASGDALHKVGMSKSYIYSDEWSKRMSFAAAFNDGLAFRLSNGPACFYSFRGVFGAHPMTCSFAYSHNSLLTYYIFWKHSHGRYPPRSNLLSSSRLVHFPSKWSRANWIIASSICRVPRGDMLIAFAKNKSVSWQFFKEKRSRNSMMKVTCSLIQSNK